MRHYYPAIVCSAVLGVTACRPTPPSPPQPRVGTTVAASFGRTWDATIDAFADRGISIETLDRSSGLIVPAGRTYAPGKDIEESLRYADCGKSGWGSIILPYSVKYNVVVRGDSSQSTVQVRAFYRTVEDAAACSSKGLFETEAEQAIKGRAEGRVGASASTATCEGGSRAERRGDDWVVSLAQTTNGICRSIPCTIRGQAQRGTSADAIELCRTDHSLWGDPNSREL